MWWSLVLSEQLLMLWVASLHWDETFTASSMLSCKQVVGVAPDNPGRNFSHNHHSFVGISQESRMMAPSG
jgi:hypothetical protein